MNKKLKILIIGGGMFVTGKGSDNFGTILPGLFNSSSFVDIEEINLVVTNVKSALYAKNIFKKINKIYKSKIKFNSYPKKINNTNEYKKIALSFKPDAAIVCVPDHLHYKITSFLLNQKIHCLVVKPLCDNLKDAIKLKNLANKNKVLGLVEFHKRLDEANVIIKNKIIKRQIGSLLYAITEFSQKKIIPTKIFKTWSAKSNVFQYLSVHYIDLIYFFTKFKPIKVQAWGQKEFLKSKKIDTWDSIQVVVEWKKPNGEIFISTHLTNWIEADNATAMSDQKISIVGTEGKLLSDQKNRGLQMINKKNNIQDINPYFSQINNFTNNNENIFFGYGIKSVSNFIQSVNKIINNKIDFKKFMINNSSFEESLISTAVVDAVNKSLKTKKSQRVSLSFK